MNHIQQERGYYSLCMRCMSAYATNFRYLFSNAYILNAHVLIIVSQWFQSISSLRFKVG